MNIADIIRTRRREQGVTQEQLAQRLGVSAPAVNKWERGVSYPDITLIPALARLLGTDANTLLSFEPELSTEANLAIQREVERLVREEGYASGFAYAQEQMRRYPASDELAIVLAQYLDGALTLYQVAEAERFRPAIDDAYERLASSAVPEVRDEACGMLIAKAMHEGRYEDAQRLLDTLPNTRIDKEERQAILHMRAGHDEEAARLWEARLIRIAADATGALGGLAEIALRDGRADDARELARRARAVAAALDMPMWMGCTVGLTVGVAEQDVATTARLLDELMGSLRHAAGSAASDAGAPASALYRYAELNDMAEMARQMGALVLAEVQAEDDYAFLRTCPEYRAFLARWGA